MDVRVELRSGGLEAYAVLRPNALGQQEAVRSVLSALQAAGVTADVDEAQVRAALEWAAANPAAAGQGVLVARGEPPKPGLNAQVLTFFSVRDTPAPQGTDLFATYPTNVTYPGEVLVQKTPPSEGVPGRTVTGEAILAPSGTDIPLLAAEGVEEAPDGATFRSKVYGLVLFHNGRIRVIDTISVTGDRMQARMTILPDPHGAEAAVVERIVRALGHAGITHGIDQAEIHAAVQKARATGAAIPQVVVANGQLPVDGQEADYRLTVDMTKKAFKAVDGERVDFKEMETVKNIGKGEILAERLPKTDPVPGFRVDGTALQARLRRAEGLRPGDHTVESEDGRHVLADADGMVVVKGGKFHVVDTYVVQGDVDFSQGNVRASGSVQIRGQVKAGFLVQAGTDVDIGEDVWEAHVEAKGNVRVRGGITAGSHVAAGGNVAARHITNSKVEAGGDIDVALSIAGSEVYARGRLTVMGSQGAIVGGEVNAAMGIQARAIGAPNSRTRIVVGVDLRVTRELEALKKEASAIPDQLAKLKQNLGKEFLKDPRGTLAALPPVLRKTKIEMLQQVQALLKREGEVAKRSEELSALALEVRDARILVTNTMAAGTFVTVGPARVTLTDNLHNVLLYYSAEENRVLWRRP